MALSNSKAILQKLERAREMVPAGAYYRHRVKGTIYQVECVTIREEDLEPSVVYTAIDGPPIPWDRRLSVFLDRFQRIELPTVPVVGPES